MNRTTLCLWLILSTSPFGCATALKLDITPSGDLDGPPDAALAQRAQELPWEREYPVEVAFIEDREGLAVDKDEVRVLRGFEARYEILGFLRVSGADGGGPLELPEETRQRLHQELRRAATVLGANLVRVTGYVSVTSGPRVGPKSTSHSVRGVALIDRSKPIATP